MKQLKLALVFFVFCTVVHAQPFSSDIASFKKQDSISFPSANQILFVGSSSFTMWKDVQDYFPEYKIVNRGFGGSSLPDVIRYADKIIYPYRPKQIVIYCGENDIAGDTTVTGKMVFNRFVQLYHAIRSNLRHVPIAYISMKPSPSRWHLRSRMIKGNELIQQFLKKKKRNGVFMNVWDAMLDETGKPREEIFLQDKLHMNVKGYAIWQKIIQPYLIK